MNGCGEGITSQFLFQAVYTSCIFFMVVRRHSSGLFDLVFTIYAKQTRDSGFLMIVCSIFQRCLDDIDVYDTSYATEIICTRLDCSS